MMMIPIAGAGAIASAAASTSSLGRKLLKGPKIDYQNNQPKPALHILTHIPTFGASPISPRRFDMHLRPLSRLKSRGAHPLLGRMRNPNRR